MSDNDIYDLKDRWIDAQLSLKAVIDEIHELSDEDKKRFDEMVVW